MIEPLLDAKQVARILGVSISTVYRLVSCRKLPAVSIAGCRRFIAADVDRYVQRGRNRLLRGARRR